MFDQKDIDEYQQIKAPSYLKEKIQSSYQPEITTRNYGKVLGFALCLLILVVSFSLFQKDSSVSILFNNKLLTHEKMDIIALAPVSMTRGNNDDMLHLTFEIETNEKMRVSVEEGELKLYDSKMNQQTVLENTGYVNDKSLIEWNIDTEEIKDHKMLFENERSSFTLLVSYDSNRQIWTICRMDNEEEK